MGIDGIGRRLIGAAGSGTVSELRDQVARLEALYAQQREEIDALRAEIASLWQGSEQGRGEAELDRLSALAEKNGNAVDALNARLKGISEQMRWDGDELRKALSVLAERIEGRQ